MKGDMTLRFRKSKPLHNVVEVEMKPRMVWEKELKAKMEKEEKLK